MLTYHRQPLLLHIVFLTNVKDVFRLVLRPYFYLIYAELLSMIIPKLYNNAVLKNTRVLCILWGIRTSIQLIFSIVF